MGPEGAAGKRSTHKLEVGDGVGPELKTRSTFHDSAPL